MNFEISVIIPVYNAARFIEKAVASANEQPEVKEIIVIEDGSTDETPKILESLKRKYKILKVSTHPGKENRGRAASRNLGIYQATSDYIAFLDADDYYLKDRFKKDKQIFIKNNGIDGVYNAIGAHFYREAKEEEKKRYELTTIKYPVPADRLYYEMAPMGNAGWFSGDGLTVRKDIFKKAGFFDENLEVAEDAHMWTKMALKGVLVSGILDKPVSMRGVHEENVFNLYGSSLYDENLLKMYLSLLDWIYKNGGDLYLVEDFWRSSNAQFVHNLAKKKSSHFSSSFFFWSKMFIKYPRLLRVNHFIYSFPVFKILRKIKNRKI